MPACAYVTLSRLALMYARNSGKLAAVVAFFAISVIGTSATCPM